MIRSPRTHFPLLWLLYPEKALTLREDERLAPAGDSTSRKSPLGLFVTAAEPPPETEPAPQTPTGHVRPQSLGTSGAFPCDLAPVCCARLPCVIGALGVYTRPRNRAALFPWRPIPPREHDQFANNTQRARRQTSTYTLTPVQGTFWAHSASSLSSSSLSPPPPPSSLLLLFPSSSLSFCSFPPSLFPPPP